MNHRNIPGFFFLIPLLGECSSWFSHCSNANLRPTNSSPKVSARRFWHKSVRKHLSSRVHKQIYRSANKHHNFSTKVQPTDAVGCWLLLMLLADHQQGPRGECGVGQTIRSSFPESLFAPRSAKGRKGRKTFSLAVVYTNTLHDMPVGGVFIPELKVHKQIELTEHWSSDNKPTTLSAE